MESVSFRNVHELRDYLTELVNKEINDNGKESLLNEVEVIFQYIYKGRFPLEVKVDSIDITFGNKERSRHVKDVDEDFLNEVKESLGDKKVTAFVDFKCRSIKKHRIKNTAFGDALNDALGDVKSSKKDKVTKDKKSSINLKEHILHIGSLLLVNTKEALDALVVSQFKKVNAKYRSIKVFKDISYSFEPKVFPIICQSTDSMDIELRINKNDNSLFVNKFSFATLDQLTDTFNKIVDTINDIKADEDVTEIKEEELDDIIVEEVDTDIHDENENTDEDTIVGEVVENTTEE